MGNVIRKDASIDSIIADVKTTRMNADAMGGAWQTIANDKIGPVATLIENIEGQIAAARKTALPLAATLEAANKKADLLLGKVSDDIWNAVGRPAADPALSLLFPEGYAYYAEGSTAEQPDRMELLAKLLESGVHPKLDAAKAAAAAGEVRAEAVALTAALDNARVPCATLALLERMRSALARSAQMELVGLKRMYKAKGFRETEIHAVIPDRPDSGAKKPSARPANPAPAPAEAPTA